MILASVFLKKVKLSEKNTFFRNVFRKKPCRFQRKRTNKNEPEKITDSFFFIFYSVFPRRKAEKNQYFVIFTDSITIGDFGTFTEIEE